MRQDKFSKAHLILYACGIIPVVWLALLLAPYMGGGLVGLVRYGGAALDHPFHIVWCEDSLKTVLIFLLCYGLGIGVYLSTDRNYRRREEHGSAKWGDPRAINRKYADKEPTANKILTHWAGWPQTPAQSVCPGGGRQRRGQDQVLRQAQHYERQHQPDRTGLQR